jgi:histidyl-tRNA synthetase
VLPPESAAWQAMVSTFSDLAARGGYGFILTPLFEEVGVFARGVGESTDIVTKEMYDFVDKGGRHLALRPEFTASVVRAFVQHRPPLPWKVWYWGPNFRYENPQAGRYRQFFQIGVEALGSPDPGLDVEVIALAVEYYQALGLARVRLLVNSLGDLECRPAYRNLLGAFLEERVGSLCPEHRDRWQENPLRVLDCKKSACVAATEDAPHQLDHLCPDCQAHWQAVTGGLDALGVEYVVEPRLVRGLDYYTRTTFEFAAEALDAAQNAVGGGGRYDGLTAAIGGPDCPGIGFSLGMDRLALAAGAEGAVLASGGELDAFVIDLVGGRQALVVAHELRRAGVRTERAFDARSMKSQMKAADRSGAAVAVIIGEDEQRDGAVTLRPLRHQGEQRSVPRADMAEAVRKMSSAGRTT